MKNIGLKIIILTAFLAFLLSFSASCEFLPTGIGGTPCTHSRVSEGSCIQMPECLDCGENVGDYTAHDYVTSVKAATCLEDGYTESVCKVCNDTKRSNVTPATGHSFGAWIVVTEPTADQAGEMRRECSACGFGEGKWLPPHEHTFENVEAKPATCTEDGWDAYQYCTECEYDTKLVKKATGHAWGAYVSGGDGTHTRTCANDPSHVLTERCSGGSSLGGSLPICEFCNTEYELAVRPGNSTYGYYALGEYPSGDGMKLLYRELTDAAEAFLISDEDVLPTDEYYIIGEFDINDYSLTMDEAMAVWKVFYVSSPAYYWLDASVVSRGDEMLFVISDIYASASERRKCDAAIEKMTEDCMELIEDGMTDLEKAMAITSYIVMNMEYAYESDGVTPESEMWAHDMTGLAVHGFGVCEAYAKSFTYLCLLNNVECAVGSGYAGSEAHAWNYVRLGGEWYGADITWTDNSGEDVVFDKFGLSSDSIFADHEPHSSTVLGVEFIYAAPELSDKDIELTALYKNGEYAGMYKSVDDAFSAMTDTEAEYEIYLGYYSSFVGALTHTVSAKTTPGVKKLTITGKNEYVGEGYLDNNSILYFASDLTLSSDLVIKDLSLESASSGRALKILLGSNTLTLDGKSVYLDARVEGLADGAELVASTERGAYVYEGIDIYKLLVESGNIVLGADSHMIYSPTTNIYTQNGASVVIDNYT